MEIEEKKSKKGLIIFAFVSLILLVVLFGGYFVYDKFIVESEIEEKAKENVLDEKPKENNNDNNINDKNNLEFEIEKNFREMNVLLKGNKVKFNLNPNHLHDYSCCDFSQPYTINNFTNEVKDIFQGSVESGGDSKSYLLLLMNDGNIKPIGLYQKCFGDNDFTLDIDTTRIIYDIKETIGFEQGGGDQPDTIYAIKKNGHKQNLFNYLW